MVKSNKALFLQRKNRLKALEKEMPKKVTFTQVNEDGGFFNWFNHEVTGRELNQFSKEVKDCFIRQNQAFEYVYNGLHEVYETFDALDKEYLQGIAIALKGNEKTVEELKETQYDINQLVQSHHKVVVGLTSFKARLETLEHLDDIDLMFERYEELHAGLLQLQEQIMNLQSVSVQHQANLGDISEKFKKVYDNLNITIETIKGEVQMVHHNLQSQDMQQMALIVDLQKKARAAKGFAILSFLIALSALVVAFVQ